MQQTMRVVVIDDHSLFVDGVELLLPQVSGGRASVVAATGDAAGAARLVQRSVPDLVLIDLHMPPPGGVKAVTAVRRAAPRVRIVAMAGGHDATSALDALRAGAEGFLPKTTRAGDLMRPLMAILDGWAVVPSNLLAELLTPARATRPAPPELDPAEQRLIRLIAGGATHTEIAAQLNVSERTVKRLTATLLRKWRVTTRIEAAVLAGVTGVIGPGSELTRRSA